MHTFDAFGAGFYSLAVFLRPLQIQVLFSFGCYIRMTAANAG
jgi:hypothetical protein